MPDYGTKDRRNRLQPISVARGHPSRRAHRNRLLPISTPLDAKVGQARLWCALLRMRSYIPRRHSALLPARIGLQSGGLDAGDRAGLILVGGVARNPDRPDYVAAGVADQHTARIGDHTPAARRIERSEEHTSELQSLTNLVCRLLLEKKN